MGKYGLAAIHAARESAKRKFASPVAEWKRAVASVFPSSRPSQTKSCPMSAFLGLCENGEIEGIPPGRFTQSRRNKAYALRAVEILRKDAKLAAHKRMLWKLAIGTRQIKENDQMDVVISLWRSGLIRNSSSSQ
jgi:hypothetical protein